MAEGFITNNILQGLINFLAPVAGIALVIFCIIQAIQIFNGNSNGSFKKLITGVLFILFILGVMFAAGSFQTYGTLFKNLTDKVITSGTSDAENIIGGDH